jgi:hypothetical protein
MVPDNMFLIGIKVYVYGICCYCANNSSYCILSRSALYMERAVYGFNVILVPFDSYILSSICIDCTRY